MKIALRLAHAAVAAACMVPLATSTLACTAVDIQAKDRTVIAGRTMEWAFDMQWTLVSLPKGTPVTMSAPPALKLPARSMPSRYSVVGVAPGVIPGNTLLEGQNEAGLGMSGNFLPGFTQYQTVTPEDRNYVSILEFGAWALGQHASVAELRAALPAIKVWTDPSLPSGPTPPLIHFVFTDRSGAGMVVEYTNGALRIFDNAAHVLTNAPTYDWHLTNLRNYLNLSTTGPASVRAGETNVTAIGQGGGLVGIPGDYTPPSRFVRSTFLRHNVPTPADAGEALQVVGHILNNVDIPIGIAQSKEGDQVVSDYTQWVALKDLTHNRILIADYAHRTNYVAIDLAPLFAQDRVTKVKVNDLPYAAPADASRAFR